MFGLAGMKMNCVDKGMAGDTRMKGVARAYEQARWRAIFASFRNAPMIAPGEKENGGWRSPEAFFCSTASRPGIVQMARAKMPCATKKDNQQKSPRFRNNHSSPRVYSCQIRRALRRELFRAQPGRLAGIRDIKLFIKLIAQTIPVDDDPIDSQKKKKTKKKKKKTADPKRSASKWARQSPALGNSRQPSISLPNRRARARREFFGGNSSPLRGPLFQVLPDVTAGGKWARGIEMKSTATKTSAVNRDVCEFSCSALARLIPGIFVLS